MIRAIQPLRFEKIVDGSPDFSTNPTAPNSRNSAISSFSSSSYEKRALDAQVVNKNLDWLIHREE